MGKRRSQLRAAFGEEKTLSEWKADPRCVVSSSCVNRRLRRGWTLEKALSTSPYEENLREAFGEKKPLGQWVQDARCVVSERTLIGRLTRGEPLEEALTRPAHQFASTRARTGKKWSAFGLSLTANQWSADPRCVVPLNVLRARLEKGIPPETALMKPVASHEREYEAFGETKSLAAWSRDARCAVSYNSLTQRMDRGWEIVDALSVPARGTGCPQEIRKKKRGPAERNVPDGREVPLEAFGETKTLREWAADIRCQVPYLRLRTRLKKNWSLEDAITKVPAVGNRNVEAFGESKSLHAWAKDPRCLVSHKALRYRMNNGESLEEAMTRPPQNQGKRPLRLRRRRNRRTRPQG